MGARLRDGLRQACQRFEVPALVSSEGPTVDVKFTDLHEVLDYRSSLSRDDELHGRMGVEMIKRGILSMSGTGFFISTVHTEEEIDETVDIFEAALRAAR